MVEGIKEEISLTEKEKLQAEMEISHAEDFSSDIRSQISALEEEEKAARKGSLNREKKREDIRRK